MASTSPRSARSRSAGSAVPAGATDRPRWGVVAHLFLAVAVALPTLVALGALAAAAATEDQSVLNRWLLLLICALFLGLVGWAALLPPVRQVEIAAANTLLGTGLPEVADPRLGRSRLAGAAWLGLLTVVGALTTAAVLYLLPVGIGLLAHPFSGRRTLTWPGGVTWRTGAGADAWWTVLLGVLALLLLGAVCRAAAIVLRRTAPVVLGPTSVERLTLADQRERDLARANALARDVHDTLGHTLTAMTVQTTVARRLLARDPQAADRALSEVERLGRQAQADVDAVVGALRDGTEPPGRRPVDPGSTEAADSVAEVRRVIAETPATVTARLPDGLPLSPGVRVDLLALVTEALTNAVRHGRGPIQLRLEDGDAVRLTVTNPLVDVDGLAGGSEEVRRDGAGRGGRGLAGLRERLLLRGGSLRAGPDGASWTLQAVLPR